MRVYFKYARHRPSTFVTLNNNCSYGEVDSAFFPTVEFNETQTGGFPLRSAHPSATVLLANDYNGQIWGRLWFNLREVAYGSNALSSPSVSGEIESQSLSFSRMFGSLGNAVGDGMSGLADEEDIDEDAFRIEDDCTAGGTVPMEIELEAAHKN